MGTGCFARPFFKDEHTLSVPFWQLDQWLFRDLGGAVQALAAAPVVTGL